MASGGNQKSATPVSSRARSATRSKSSDSLPHGQENWCKIVCSSEEASSLFKDAGEEVHKITITF